MKQVLIIHGGTSFSTYEAYRSYLDQKELSVEKLTHPAGWKERLATDLPSHQVLCPTMPNAMNAVFDEWTVYFEKLIEFLDCDVQILGHSLGAMFLAKYLNEKPLKQKVSKIILVSGGYDDESVEDLGSFKVTSAKNLAVSAEQVHLIHSKDDPVVPFFELSKFQADLPSAISHIFTNRGHFVGEEFPEILDIFKQK